MAATAAGRRLTASHRRLQLALRAQFIREFLSIAPAWLGDARSFATLVAATIPLVQLRNRESSALALRYLDAFRRAELGEAAGRAAFASAATPSEDTIRAGMWATGQNQVRRSLAGGMSVQAARRAALVRLSGATSRNVLNGGRETTLDAVRADREARGWQRVTAGSPCAFCVTLASRGPVFRSESSADFQSHAACVTGATLVTGPLVQHRFRRYFEGELVVIGTAGGNELAITPNHPVLTSRGWVPAGSLREGDYLAHRSGTDLHSLGVPHERDVPTPIEDVWRSPGVDAFVSMPVAAEDFHGDGLGSEGYVDVVTADRFLALVGDAQDVQLIAEPGGAGAVWGALGGFACRSHLAQLLLGVGGSALGVMGCLGVPLALLGGQSLVAQLLRLAEPATLDAGLNEPPLDGRAGDAKAQRDRLFGLAREVRGGDVRGHVDAVPPGWTDRRPDGHAKPFEFSAKGVGMYADDGARLLQRLAGGVELRRVLDLRRVGSWSGHVFNLQTSEGWYCADGVIVSNCACTAEPVFESGAAGWSDQALQHRATYQRAQREARAAGELDRGTSNDAVNAVRRALSGA